MLNQLKFIKMKEIKEIKKNYEMGFISSQEFLCEYAGVLSKL